MIQLKFTCVPRPSFVGLAGRNFGFGKLFQTFFNVIEITIKRLVKYKCHKNFKNFGHFGNFVLISNFEIFNYLSNSIFIVVRNDTSLLLNAV